jgi:hypothetical protein
LWGIVIGTSCIPGIVVVLPPVIVAATGAACLPLIYGMERIVKYERELLYMPDFPVAMALEK